MSLEQSELASVYRHISITPKGEIDLKTEIDQVLDFIAVIVEKWLSIRQ